MGEIHHLVSGQEHVQLLQQPGRNGKEFYKGWMYTGDLGYWSENLYITVNGRKDDMIGLLRREYLSHPD